MKRILATIVAAFLLATGVNAGNNDLKKETNEIKGDLAVINNARITSQKLDHLIDLWHDACLKGEMSLINHNQVLIFSLIEENLRIGSERIGQAEKELHISKTKVQQGESAPVSKKNSRKDLFDDNSDLKEVRNLLMAKTIIYQSMRRSDSFSNRYRLLGDYAELLKREVDLNKVELAEDVEDHREP